MEKSLKSSHIVGGLEEKTTTSVLLFNEESDNGEATFSLRSAVSSNKVI